MVWCTGICRNTGEAIEFGYPDDQPLICAERDYARFFSSIEIVEYIPSKE